MYAVHFWQNAKHVMARVTASNAAMAESIVLRTFAGVEIIRVQKTAPGPTSIKRSWFS